LTVIPQSFSGKELPYPGDGKRHPITFKVILSDLKYWAKDKKAPLFSTLCLCLEIMTPSPLPKYSGVKIIGDKRIHYLNRTNNYEHAINVFCKCLVWQTDKTLLELYSLVFPKFLFIEVVNEKIP